MPTRHIMIDGIELLVEIDPEFSAAVPPLVERGAVERGTVSDNVRDVGQDLRNVLVSVTKPIREVLATCEPEEWGMELSLGFKGEAGIPCITRGEANGAIKVTVKWKNSKPDTPKP